MRNTEYRAVRVRPRPGRDVFARGAAEGLDTADRTVPPLADTAALLRACPAVLERPDRGGSCRSPPIVLWRAPDALARLRRMLPATVPEGAPLESLLPDLEDDGGPGTGLRRRSALASTLLAGLEMGREGCAALVQDEPFGPVAISALPSAPPP